MTEDELKVLQKSVRKKKRIATELASQVHDLVEDTLWSEYDKLPEIAAKCADACKEWAEANQELEQQTTSA